MITWSEITIRGDLSSKLCDASVPEDWRPIVRDACRYRFLEQYFGWHHDSGNGNANYEIHWRARDTDTQTLGAVIDKHILAGKTT